MNLLEEIESFLNQEHPKIIQTLYELTLHDDDLFHNKEMSSSELEGVLNGRKIWIIWKTSYKG